MQDVNDDMDNLFRNAAEQYPLQTDGADWQKVLAGLQDASVPVAEEKEKKKRRFLWLFLLLPLGLLWAVHDKGNRQQAAVVKEDVKQIDHDLQKSGSTLNGNFSSRQVNDSAAVSGISSAEKKADKNSTAISENRVAIPSDNKEKPYQKSVPTNSSGGSAVLKNKKEDFGYKQPVSNNNISLSDNGIGNGTSGNKNNFSGTQPEVLSNRIDVDRKDRQGNINKSADGTVQAKNDSAAFASTKADSAANNNINTNKSKQMKVKPRVQNGFYAGLLGSFDVSTIKLQRINKAGHGFELLVGYRFSNRISVESGIGWTEKKYYSTGKYFDKSRTGIPEASKIIFTNGTCAMLEIPATVKYDFAQKQKSSWFATAGLSSYIMKDETYSYYANHSGNYYDATRKYSHSGSNLFSVASLSVGYQLQLNKHLSLRAEPYIKMPLSGIGIAKMPITSMGIAAGFTRSF